MPKNQGTEIVGSGRVRAGSRKATVSGADVPWSGGESGRVASVVDVGEPSCEGQ